MVVPKDFGDQKLVWTLTAHGQTEQVAGTLKPVWMIDRKRTTRGGNSENINSNTPPVVSVRAPRSDAYRSRFGHADRLRDRRRAADAAGQAVGMTVVWAKYRGPGRSAFSIRRRPRSSMARRLATASFSEPGEYVLQAVVDDGSGEVGREFRLSLLLDERPGEGHGRSE